MGRGEIRVASTECMITYSNDSPVPDSGASPEVSFKHPASPQNRRSVRGDYELVLPLTRPWSHMWDPVSHQLAPSDPPTNLKRAPGEMRV